MTKNKNNFSGIDAGTMRISNQKNGVKNQTIHHEALPTVNESCPVKDLAELVKDLREHQANKST